MPSERLSGKRPPVKLLAAIAALWVSGSCVPSELEDRHASVVEAFLPAPDVPPLATFGKPERALGPPDGRTVAIGQGSFVVLRFFRTIPNGPGPDLRVYELGEDGAQAKVAVSRGGVRFVELPTPIEGPVVEVDFDQAELDLVTHVRIRGLDDAGSEPGFDLDALEALH